ncbi:glycosyltransferase family 4 protein [Xanthovirga aplysinae]|uniref:glycosyltransferase family 4 protein n=1 Tax=Xanthovirga aplysinae TaxID=2529853 RepID=UPI0012BCEE6B|nr:glycosyltransferase family 4 protein [Xanthovirga aplysinae]MTI33129.1 glycosyltransferase [Xanthovirga aplysinae]
MPYKILVISNYRSTQTVRPEAEVFIGLAKLGHQIDIMTYGDGEYVKIFKDAGIRVIDFHPKKKFSSSTVKFLRNWLIKEKYDFLHLFTSKAIINGLRASRNLPVKVILYRGYAGNVHWYDPTAYLKFLNPRVDKIICNSNAVNESLAKQLFFKKEKLVTILKGHHPSWYDNIGKMDLEKELNIPQNHFKIVCIANVRPVKGIPDLIKSTYFLQENIPIHLLLIGQGMDSKEMQDLINKSPIKNRIHILGPKNDPLNILAASNVLVLPSLKEGLPKVVIEAMSLGIPTISTDIPGIKDLVIHEENGLKVPVKSPRDMANAIIKLHKNPLTLEKMGRNAKKHMIDHLHIDKTIIKTIQMYRELSYPNQKYSDKTQETTRETELYT